MKQMRMSLIVEAVPAMDKNIIQVTPLLAKDKKVRAAKMIKKRTMLTTGYSLGYFSLWWSRMEREARKDERVQKEEVVRQSHELRLRQMLDIEPGTEVDRAEEVNNMEMDCVNVNLCKQDNILSNSYNSVRGVEAFSGPSIGFCVGGDVLSRNEEVIIEHTQALERENAIYGQHQGYSFTQTWQQSPKLGELRSREVKTIIEARNMDPT